MENEFMKHIKLYESWEPKLDHDMVWDSMEWRDSYRDLFPGYSDQEQEFTEEYYFDSREKAEEFADNIIGILDALPNPIPVYRAIMAKSREDIDLEYPGESWSFDRESAINFGSRNGSNYLLSGTIDKEHVNWAGTVKTYTIFSGGYTDEDENEIVIDEQDKITDLTVEEI